MTIVCWCGATVGSLVGGEVRWHIDAQGVTGRNGTLVCASCGADVLRLTHEPPRP